MGFLQAPFLGEGHGSTRLAMLYISVTSTIAVRQAYDYDAYGNMTVRGSDPNATPVTDLLYSGGMIGFTAGYGVGYNVRTYLIDPMIKTE